jgi:hypothetical protein
VKAELILKRASASRTSGEWNEDDYDVLANSIVIGRILIKPAMQQRSCLLQIGYIDAFLFR